MGNPLVFAILAALFYPFNRTYPPKRLAVD